MKIRRSFRIILVGLVILMILGGLGFDLHLLDVIGYLVVGWVMFLKRVLPQAHVNWSGIGSGVAALMGVVVVSHLIGRWLWRESGKKVQPIQVWPARWTIAIIGIIVLTFVSGIVAIGITHQTAWLIRSDQPMFVNRYREGANRARCNNNMQQIGFALQQYATAHDGHFPDTLEELFVASDITSDVFVCPSTITEKAPGSTTAEQSLHLHEHNDYVYHGRGLRSPLSTHVPILCEPLINHDEDGMNILFGDLHVEWKKPTEAEKVLK